MNDSQIQKYFYDHQGKPILKKSFYIYMDILGFKEQIENERFFQDFYQVLHENYSKGNQERPIFAKIFSDNVAWILPYLSDKPRVEEINVIISILQSYQCKFIKKGIFLRGAVTIGKIFYDDLILYGKPLLEAYELESKIANFPRVILSTDFFSCVKTNHFYSNQDYCNHPLYQRKDILIGPDGQPFINYLNYYKNFDKNKVYWDDVRTHKNFLENNLKKYLKDPYIFPKYHWVANYHNYFCLQNSSDIDYHDDYLIRCEFTDSLSHIPFLN